MPFGTVALLGYHATVPPAGLKSFHVNYLEELAQNLPSNSMPAPHPRRKDPKKVTP
jgi:hypothetical protein